MAVDRFSQDLDDFNSYYAPDYDKENDNKKSKKSKNAKNTQKNNDGKNLLRNAENSLIGNNSSNDSSWVNNVAGKTAAIPGPKYFKLTKRRGGFAAIIAILIFLIGGGFFLGSTNILLPGAINANFTSSTNSGYAGYTLRSVKLTSYMLKNLNNTVTTDLKGFARYTHMSSALKQRLAKNNIVVDGSGSSTTLLWTKTTTTGDLETIPISADAFPTEYVNNADFRKDYDTARRGRVATFFDNVAERVYNKLGFSRNIVDDSKITGNNATDEDSYKSLMADQVDNNSTKFNNRGKVEEYEYETDENGTIKIGEDGNPVVKTDADGNPIKKTQMENETVATSQTGDSSVDADGMARSYVLDLANKLAVGANGVCSLMKFGHAISVVISALEKYASMHVFLNPMENVSRTMDGAPSYINSFLNNFTTPVEAEVELYNEEIQISGFNISGSDYSASEGATTSLKKKTVYGAPIQSQGSQMILGGSKRVSNDIVNYSSERVSSSIAKVLRMSKEDLQKCYVVQAGAAVVSFATTILSAGTKVVADFAWDIIKGAVIGFAASAIVSFAIPTLAKYLFTNIFETVTGIPAGELFASGAANANFSNGVRGSGQIFASKEAVLQYNQDVQKVAALDAEVDRLTLSPLDITSPNTFLGSIAYSTLLPIATSSNGILSTIGSIFRTTSKSLSNIIGAAHASGEGENYMVTFGNDLGICPQVDALGYACDIYGNPIPITVLLNIEPDDDKYKDFINENFDDDGNVKEGKFLAKFLLANVNRESAVGVVDTNILGAFEVDVPILGSLPFIGDLIDLWNAAQGAENINWADGTYIGYSDNNKYREQAALASTIVMDNRALDMLSGDSELAYQNPITAFLEKHEAENPVDNSFIGYLSRITGLPKDTVETVVAAAEYYEFLNHYDPSTRIAMTAENTAIQSAETLIARFDDAKLNYSTDTNSEPQTEVFLAKQSEQYIIYADIRNRSHAA